jgi:hypothetical protein
MGVHPASPAQRSVDVVVAGIDGDGDLIQRRAEAQQLGCIQQAGIRDLRTRQGTQPR